MTSIIKPTTYQELLDTLMFFGNEEKQGLIDRNQFMFRGQGSASWKLESRLRRVVKEIMKEMNTQSDLRQLEGIFTEHFVRNAQLFENRLPNLDDKIAWLTLMQHHGAPTRLIDWSWSPFVALFMALIENLPNDIEEAAIYVLNYELISEYWQLDKTGPSIWGNFDNLKPEFPYSRTREAENEIIECAINSESEYLPIPVKPRHTIQRYRVQQAVLTVAITENADIDENLKLNPKHLNPLQNINNESLLQKIIFPRDWRIQLLKKLVSMGITHSTMFPTLDGLGKETSMLRFLHINS